MPLLKTEACRAALRPLYGFSSGQIKAKVTVSKGSQLYIEGKLQTRSWEDRHSGEKKYRTEIVADDLVLLGSRQKGVGSQPVGSNKGEKAKPTAPATGDPGISDDNLPF